MVAFSFSFLKTAEPACYERKGSARRLAPAMHFSHSAKGQETVQMFHVPGCSSFALLFQAGTRSSAAAKEHRRRQGSPSAARVEPEWPQSPKALGRILACREPVSAGKALRVSSCRVFKQATTESIRLESQEKVQAGCFKALQVSCERKAL